MSAKTLYSGPALPIRYVENVTWYTPKSCQYCGRWACFPAWVYVLRGGSSFLACLCYDCRERYAERAPIERAS